MVKVEEVLDAERANSPYASSASSHTGSSDSLASVSSVDTNEDLSSESIFDRLSALVDIVPPSTRHSISTKIRTTTSYFTRGSKVLGNIAWVLATTGLLVALPLALALEDEAKIMQQEREMMAQQQGQQLLTPSSVYGQPGSIPGQNQTHQGGLVPPGF